VESFVRFCDLLLPLCLGVSVVKVNVSVVKNAWREVESFARFCDLLFSPCLRASVVKVNVSVVKNA
jgi:hypothetical protein